MALLLGQETESAGAEIATAAKASIAFKFTALATGKVTALHVTFSANGAGTSCNIAIQANEGGATGKPVEGVLVEGVLSSTTAGSHEVAVAETEVIAGTEYWLTLQPQGGNSKIKPGSTAATRLDGTSHSKISEDKSAEWAAESKKGPAAIWATGTTGESVKGKASGALLLSGTAAGTLQAVVSATATGALLLAGTAQGTVAQRVEGKATGALLLTGTATGSTKEGASVSGKATGILTLTGTAQGSQQAVVTGSAAGVLRLTGKAKGRLAPTGGRKVAIFVFED